VAHSMSEWAASYARAGWRIFPLHTPQGAGCSCGKPDCHKIAKHPRISNWQHAASCDLETVAAWWAEFPDANIGMTLAAHLAVLDVDPRHGGLESLTALESEHGPLNPQARQRSGSGGWHYLMEEGERIVPVVRGFRPGLDLLTGAGCYIVVAPSVHACGGLYEWTDEPHPLLMRRDNIMLRTPPDWLLDVARGIKAKAKGPKKIFTLPNEIGEGKRDTTLASAAGKMRRAGFSIEEILATLHQINRDRCKPPLAEADIQRIAKSIGRKTPAPIDEDEGMTKALASAITVTDYFARDQGAMLYHFKDGVYKPKGQRFIERRVKELCQSWEKTKTWSPELATKVGEWLLADAPELWERPPLDTLNCVNGLLDIPTRTLREHSPEHLSVVQIAAKFDPEAKCPQIDAFIKDVFPSDTLHLPFEIVAWLMLPDTSIQKAILTLGEGANGKSIWLNLLVNFLGRENVSTISLHRIESDRFSCARLVGKLCNIGADLPTAALVGTSMFKALTGGDIVSAERKFEASFEFRPFARLLFSANSAPRSDDATHGFFRRWLVIPFNRTFDETDPNTIPAPVLNARLSQPGELSGMLNRALDMLQVVRQGRFTESASTNAAWDEFRRSTDPMAVWLDQQTVERADAVIPKDKLRGAYSQVCLEAGRPIVPDSQFTGALKRLRPNVQAAQRRVDGKQCQVFVGLGWVTLDAVPSGKLF
jgi:P4 family phage/plasmid primase-like protien